MTLCTFDIYELSLKIYFATQVFRLQFFEFKCFTTVSEFIMSETPQQLMKIALSLNNDEKPETESQMEIPAAKVS